ncbi:hypothetical protein DFH08DRAFT_121767 [Mycena albidolilacea]|uniref:Uncharacterized protein n=1 Tax=Mycena albidolilacea TaxID=1033008 RepID=A0AAD7E7D9_9AGAR|nr:hypothetical protein DFH08DRAFT_121767 [Mycena albidolilacea]
MVRWLGSCCGTDPATFCTPKRRGNHIGYSLANIFQRKWHVKKIEGTLKVDKDDYWQLADDDLQDIRTSARRDNTTDPKVIAKRVAKAFSSMLEKDRKRHGSDPDEEIPEAATTTDDAAISYQADIDAALDARNQGQNPLPTTEVEPWRKRWSSFFVSGQYSVQVEVRSERICPRALHTQQVPRLSIRFSCGMNQGTRLLYKAIFFCFFLLSHFTEGVTGTELI